MVMTLLLSIVCAGSRFLGGGGGGGGGLLGLRGLRRLLRGLLAGLLGRSLGLLDGRLGGLGARRLRSLGLLRSGHCRLVLG